MARQKGLCMKNRILLAILLLIFLFALTSCIGDTASASGDKGDAPYIGENGNWWIGSNDLGVPAQGPKGEKGDQGDPGSQGEPGTPGVPIRVLSVAKSSSNGNVDTYTIAFSDGSEGTFQVTNGVAGQNAPGISSIEKTGSEGLIDTYQILLADGRTFPFQISNGEDGETVTISAIKRVEYDTYQITLSNGETNVLCVSDSFEMDGTTVTGVALKETQGNVDYYEIHLSDGTTVDFSLYNTYGVTFDSNGVCYVNEEKLFDLRDPKKPFPDGITFSTVSYNGTIGLVVTDFQSNDEYFALPFNYEFNKSTKDDDSFKIFYTQYYFSARIPDSVGSLPVIGIANEVFKNCKLCSITLSKNTLFIGEGAFKDSELRKINFNGAKITKIENYVFSGSNLCDMKLPNTIVEIGAHSFENTKLTKVVLPDATRKLDDYAFDKVLLSEINLDGVTYFGANVLTSLTRGYVYLGEDVEYVGNNAFPSSFIYLESDTKPASWASSIGDSHPICGCRYTGDYIYSINEDKATVYYYTGSEKRISIPAQIDQCPVTAIGYGFNSLSNSALTALDNAGMLQTSNQTDSYYLDEVRIPNTVKTIDYCTFVSSGTMIFIPSSVEEMWYGVGIYTFGDFDHYSYLAFEGSSAPTFVQYYDFTTISGTYSLDDWKSLSNRLRYSLEIDPGRVVLSSDSRTYYYSNTANEYALLAVMDDQDESTYTVKASYNGIPVTMIKPYAISSLTNVESIIIETGIKKIKGCAFTNLNLHAVYIPTSVEIINENGFNGVCTLFCCGANSKPDEWDSKWAGNNTASCTVVYSTTPANMPKQNAEFIYMITPEETVTLIKTKGTSTTVYIPRTVDSYPVTAIASKFFDRTESSTYSSASVYVPNCITSLASRSFVNNHYLYVYFEAPSRPAGTPNDYSYSSYSRYEYFNQTLSY